MGQQNPIKPDVTIAVHDIQNEIRDLADKEVAEHSQAFFKAGKGGYGAGDKFLGIRVPEIRKLVKHFKAASINDALFILHSPFHEERLFALLLLVEKFNSGDVDTQCEIFQCYMNNLKYVNNWDLVDSSAHHIVGGYLDDKDKKPLFDLVHSDSLWQRRIAIIASYYFIKHDAFDTTLALADELKQDNEDLIQKAVGWMLREVGNRDLDKEKEFLDKYYEQMPRTMLRYAIEKFPEQERLGYLKGTAT